MEVQEVSLEYPLLKGVNNTCSNIKTGNHKHAMAKTGTTPNLTRNRPNHGNHEQEPRETSRDPWRAKETI